MHENDPYPPKDTKTSHITSAIDSVIANLNKKRLVDTEIDKEFLTNKTVAQKMYTTVYHGVGIKFKLNPTEILLFSTIFALSKKRGYSYASQGLYAHMFGITTTTINTALKKLRKSQLIEKAPGKGPSGTTRWRVSPFAQDFMIFLQNKIEEAKREKHRGKL